MLIKPLNPNACHLNCSLEANKKSKKNRKWQKEKERKHRHTELRS